jgi:hypothetical protein
MIQASGAMQQSGSSTAAVMGNMAHSSTPMPVQAAVSSQAARAP